MKTGIKQAGRLVGGAIALWLVAATAMSAPAATPREKSSSDWNMKGWKLAIHDDNYREEAKIFGKEAFQDKEGLFQIKSVHLETYGFDPAGTTQTTNLIIEAATCQWDLESRVAHSPDSITAFTADGKFRTTGKGFQWSQHSGLLIITNGVRTTLIPPPPAAKENAPSAGAQEPITITSLELILDLVGMYDVQAFVIGGLSELPAEGVGLAVVGRNTKGEAHIRIFDGTGKRVVDAPDSSFPGKAEETAKLRAELAPLGGGKPLSAEATRKIRAAASVITGHALRGVGRFAQYRRVVDVRHPSGASLKSFELIVSFRETGAEGLGPSEVIAGGNVLIEGDFQGETVSVRGEKAIYTVSPATITLPDNPTIETGANRLTGQTASINLEDQENLILSVDGMVRMEAISPAPVAAGAGKPDVKTVIQAESLKFAQQADSVVFERSVTVERSDGVKLKSEWLSAAVDAANDRVGRIEAKRNVMIEMIGETGKAVATSGSAIIDEAAGLVVLRKEGGAQPEILQGENLLRGDDIELNIGNLEDLRMKATGNTHLKAVKLGDDFNTPVELQADKFSYGGKILLAEGNAELAFALPGKDKNAPAVPLNARAQSIIVDQKLGTATLDTAVRIVDAEGLELTCNHLVVDIPKPDAEVAELTDLTATGAVVMTTVKDGRTSRAMGEKAVYSAASGDLVLTGNCQLEYDGNQIFGDRIVTKLDRQGEAQLRAEGHARMEFAVESQGERKRFQATADQIVFDEKTGAAQLAGNAHIKNDAGLDIRCNRVDVEMPKDAGKPGEKPGEIPSFVASGAVIARIPHESRIFDVRCDRAVYAAVEDALELRGNITGETPEGEIQGTRFKYHFTAKRSTAKVGRFEIDVDNAMKTFKNRKNPAP